MKYVKQGFIMIASGLVASAVALYFLPPWAVLSIMTILYIHEIAHYGTAKWLAYDPHLPFFIPIGIGGLGVTYIEKDLSPTQRMIVAAAGPIAGFIGSIMFLGLGLTISSTGISTLAILLGAGELFNFFFGPDSSKIKEGVKEFLNRPETQLRAA